MPDLNAIQNLSGALGPDSARLIQEALQGIGAKEGGKPVDGASFSDMLGDLLNKVDSAQKQADESIRKLAEGDSVSIQDVVLRMEEAELTFRLMKEIRDKLISAYKEVMSMQG
jgi:flagellar hook-basal body complex protein FliE